MLQQANSNPSFNYAILEISTKVTTQYNDDPSNNLTLVAPRRVTGVSLNQ